MIWRFGTYNCSFKPRTRFLLFGFRLGRATKRAEKSFARRER